MTTIVSGSKTGFRHTLFLMWHCYLQNWTPFICYLLTHKLQFKRFLYGRKQEMSWTSMITTVTFHELFLLFWNLLIVNMQHNSWQDYMQVRHQQKIRREGGYYFSFLAVHCYSLLLFKTFKFTFWIMTRYFLLFLKKRGLTVKRRAKRGQNGANALLKGQPFFKRAVWGPCRIHMTSYFEMEEGLIFDREKN